MHAKCFHCGDPCPQPAVRFEDHDFCCEGCKAVYQILQASDLGAYYDMLDAPAGRGSNRTAEQYAYLDEPEVFRQLIDFQDEHIAKISFELPQIHCSACLWLLERLPAIHAGIIHSQVDFLQKTCFLTFSPAQIKLSELVHLLAKIGYEPNLRLQNLQKKQVSGFDRGFYTRLGVAGFCFGNMMLLALPEYLSPGSLEPAFRQFFAYVNLLLALPVLLYSSSVFFGPAWRGLRQGMFSIDVPVSLGILVLFGWSSWEILSQSGPGYLDSLAGLVFFLLLGKWFQHKTYHRLHFDHDYGAFFPLSATLLEGGRERSVAISALQAGDRLLLRHAELLPADAVLQSPEAQIDYSFVTGESEPVHKQAGEQLYAGGRLMGAAVEVALTRAVSQSYLTRLWQQSVFKEQRRPGLHTLIDKMSKHFTLVIISIALLAGGWWAWHAGPAQAIRIMAAVLIIACPCGLALTMPITLGNALRLLAKRQFYFRDIHALAGVAGITHIVWDKTGTLTSKERVQTAGTELQAEAPRLIASLAHQSAHPVSRQLEQLLGQHDYLEVEDFCEIPGQGIAGRVGGHQLRIGTRQFSLGGEAGAPEGATCFSIDGRPGGYLLSEERLRPGIQALLQRLARRYDLLLLSGDHQHKGEALRQALPAATHIMMEQSPHDKLARIQALQAAGHKVMMIGDGLNDAGALKQSDVGVAISESAEGFSPACDAILHARALPGLDRYLQYARRAMQLVRTGIGISLLYNLLGIALAVQGLLSPVVVAILMPLSSVSVVLFGMGSTYYAARKLGPPVRESG